MFPGTASKFFLKLLVTIPVAPIVIGIIVHFRFHIRFISIHKLLYFNFFSDSFCTTFLSAGIATSINVYVFSFLFLIIISGLFAVTYLSVCTSWFHNTVTYYYYYYYYYYYQVYRTGVFLTLLLVVCVSVRFLISWRYVFISFSHLRLSPFLSVFPTKDTVGIPRLPLMSVPKTSHL